MAENAENIEEVNTFIKNENNFKYSLKLMYGGNSRKNIFFKTRCSKAKKLSTDGLIILLEKENGKIF